MNTEREKNTIRNNPELTMKRRAVLTPLLCYDDHGGLVLGGKRYKEGNKWFMERVLDTYLSDPVSYLDLCVTLERGYDAPQQLIRGRLTDLQNALQGENIAVQITQEGRVVDRLSFDARIQVIDKPQPPEQKAKAMPLTEAQLELVYVASRFTPLPDDIRKVLNPLRPMVGRLFAGKDKKEPRAYKAGVVEKTREALAVIDNAVQLLEQYDGNPAFQKIIEYLHEQFAIEAAKDATEMTEGVEVTLPTKPERREVKLEDMDKKWKEHVSFILDRLPPPESESGLIRSTQLVKSLHIKLVRWNDAVKKLYTGETRGHHEELLPEEAAMVVYYAKYGRGIAKRGLGPRAVKALFPKAYQRELAERAKQAE